MHESHGGDCNVFQCNKCDKSFYLEWRLKQHSRIHNKKTKFCHYFNRSQECPFEQFGCKFKHELAPLCKFDNNCNRKLCQYKHSVVESVRNAEPVNQNIKVSETSQPSVDESYDFEVYEVAEELFCKAYCGDEKSRHIHCKEDWDYYRGINMKNIKEGQHPWTDDFFVDYPCNLCDKISDSMDKHRRHIKTVHKDEEILIQCVIEKCVHRQSDPEKLVDHIAHKHKEFCQDQ